jgi:enhancing lycopene biosynthesis protein 2
MVKPLYLHKRNEKGDIYICYEPDLQMYKVINHVIGIMRRFKHRRVALEYFNKYDGVILENKSGYDDPYTVI